MVEKPWLILTLRRTGGTSLTGFLARVSRFRTIEHEPFNPERRLAHVTALSRPGADQAALMQAMSEALQERPNIKHCFEFLPFALTAALVTQACRLGYGIVLLTRRDEARRQLSLSLAMATGAWGQTDAARIYPAIEAGEIIPPAIDLAALRARVRQDYLALGQVLALLRARRIAHDWLLFEELYDRPDRLPDTLVAIASGLGVQVASDDPRLQGLSGQRGQNSARIAPHIGNYDKAAELLSRLCLR